MLDGNVVDQETNFEIVTAVHDQVDVLSKAFDVVGVDVRDDWIKRYRRVDSLQVLSGCDGFGEHVFDIVFFKQNLPLEVADFQKVSINDPQKSHAGANQGVRNG